MANLQDQLTASLSGAYTIERELGGGGMSRVFLAEESRLRRKVVVKVLSPELAAGLSAERFEREIQLAASLMQANIVPVLASGDTGGLPYYTMPFVEGESLRSHLDRQGGIAAEAVPGILRDVARALAYAHERGVVHRDIKPDNVLISGGAAVVTDFGIAKAIAAARTQGGGATLTQSGTAIGTPAYMAPEQAAGDPDVDHRADIYALGCMAYELLSGKQPFAGRTPQRTLAAHMNEPPAPLGAVAPSTSPALAALVMACLEKDPIARPQSANDVIKALDAVASGSSGETRRAPARPGGRRALAIGGVAVALVAAALLASRTFGFGPFASLSGRMGDGRVLIGDFRAISTDTALGNVVAEAVRADLAQSNAITLVQPATIAAQMRAMSKPAGTKLDTAVAHEIAIRAGIPAFVTGEITGLGAGFVVNVRLIGSDSGQTLASFSEPANAPQDLIPTIGKITRRLRSKVGESLRHLQRTPKLADATTPSLEALRRFTEGAAAHRTNNYTTAIRLYEEAIAIDSQFAGAYRGAAQALGNIGSDREREMRYAKKAFELSARLPEAERYQTRAAYFTRTDPLKAIDEYELLHQLRPNSSAPLNNMASVEKDFRQYERAELHYRQAIAIDSMTSFAQENLVVVLLNRGRVAAADSALTAMQRRIPDHPLTGYATVNALWAHREFDSLAAYHEAVMREARDPSILVAGNITSSDLYTVLGRFRDADRHKAVTTAAARRADNSGADYPYELAGRGLVQSWYLGDRAGGLKLIDQALAESQKARFENRPYWFIATAYGLAAEPAKAKAALAEYRRQPNIPSPSTEQSYRTIESLIAYAEKRYVEGIRLARAADTGECMACSLPYLAMNYDLAGQPDSAIAVYSRYVKSMDMLGNRFKTDAFFLTGAYKRLGELLEAKGDAKGALENYEQFLRIWKNADPVLQPQVADVRKRVDRLRRVGG